MVAIQYVYQLQQLIISIVIVIFISIHQIECRSSSSSLASASSPSKRHSITKRAEGVDKEHWNYENQRDWILIDESVCGGYSQSPVNLESSTALVDKNLNLDFNSYDKLIDTESGTVLADGHSLRMNINNPGTYLLTGVAVDRCTYQLLQVHVHWGSTSMSGSEHTFDGERFAAEIHFVHKDVQYATQSPSISNNTKLYTAVGVIAKRGDSNPGLDILLEAMESNRSNINYRLKSAFDLNHFLPKNRKSFFKYRGSFTTPNCEEVVNWIVMKDTIEVSNEQLIRLRGLIDQSDHLMKNVIRETQPLMGRTVFQSDSGSSIVPTLTSFCYIILYLIIHITLIQKSTFN